VRAVDDVSFEVAAGRNLRPAGRIGLRQVDDGALAHALLPDAGSIVGGRVLLGGRDLLALSESEMRECAAASWR
jgi:peptide/nickel transport system ATP-binding protein